MVEYLFSITKKEEQLKDGPAILFSRIDFTHPFHLMALFYFKKTMYSKLFQGPCDWALPSKIEEA